MMMSRRIGVVLTAVSVAVAGCSAGSEPEEQTSSSATSVTSEEPFTSDGDAAIAATTSLVFDDGPLIDVCGQRVVVQTAGFPDVGAGPLYALLGSSPMIDAERQVVSAPLTRADGTVEETTLEVRSGGPAVGFRSPIALMAEDGTISVALASTAAVVRDASLLETRAVASLTDRSRDALIVDPATYPGLVDIASVGDQNVEVRHVTDAPMIAFLTATGVLRADQLVAGSDGLPASFVEADGAIAQQGDLTVGPALYPTLPQWGRPVDALAAADAGWRSLDDMIVADATSERVSEECLGRLVRVIQQSIVAYVADPMATNRVMSEVRSQFNPLARLTPTLFDTGTQLATDAGVFDTQSDQAPGTILTDDLEVFLADLAAALDVDPVAVDQLVDTRFVDATISR